MARSRSCLAAIGGWGGLLLLLLTSLPLRAEVSDPEVAQKLQRMSEAMRRVNYDATLVYLHDNRLEAMRLIHLVVEGSEREQLISLNGAERGVIRDSQKVTCLSAGRGGIAVNKVSVAQDLLPARHLDPALLSRNYVLRLLGEARVAGRQTEVVGIMPRDAYRYGYRFAIDRETGLLLKSDLMDESGRPIEQIMFTSLNLNPSGLVEQAGQEREVSTWHKEKTDAGRTVPEVKSAWSFDSLPAGFSLTLTDHWQDLEGKLVDHLLLTDGLASMSIYIERSGPEGLVGGAGMGAINAWGGGVAGHQVTVVGEVPAVTAEKVFRAIRHSPQPQ